MAEAALAKLEPATTALVRPADSTLSIDEIVARVDKIREVRSRVMKADVHYGKVPGTDRDTLLKPGAETLCMTFRLVPKFHAEEHREGDHLEVVITCTLVHALTGTVLGEGIGSCSTRESKYAWRKGERACPACGKACIIRANPQYEREERFKGGWLCYGKKGGCGAKFEAGDPAILGQQTGRAPNPDIADLYNTVRKMACKRAHVAATLFATGASELFTQDVEDAEPVNDSGTKSAADEPAPRQAPKVAPVASDEDVENVLAAIAECQSTDQLAAVSKANRNRKWNADQKKRMKDAFDARTKALTNPDNDGREPEPEASDGDFRTMVDAIMRSPSLQYLETLWKQAKSRRWTPEQLSALESAYDSRASDLTPPPADQEGAA
jgi:hypothetical protein